MAFCWRFVTASGEKKKKSTSETQTGADLVNRDDGGGPEAVDSVVKEVEPELEHVNRALDDQEAAAAIGRAEENVDMHVVDTACHSPSDDSNSGVEDADIDSNADERQVDSFIVNGLNSGVSVVRIVWSSGLPGSNLGRPDKISKWKKE